LSDRRAGRLGAALAEHPQLLPPVAVFLLTACNKGRSRMMHSAKAASAIMVGAAVGLGLTAAAAQDKKIVIGVTCDRTGPTQIVGTVLCPAAHDYIEFANATHMLDGYSIDHSEIETGYKVPAAVEAYQRQKLAGAVIMPIYCTPQTHAL